MTNNQTRQIRINILAYNEADFIEQCLDSIQLSLSALNDVNAEVNIICNGCRDNTYSVAKRYCKNLPSWQAYDIKLGDKANAWNFAIKLGEKFSALSIFIDGDCTITPESINALLASYDSDPDCHIIAGVPKTKGRTTDNIIRNTLNGQALSGAFYALTPQFIDTMHQLGFQLPKGLIGDDSLLAWAASHNFKLSNGFTPGFLRGCEGAEFYYHRLTPTNLKNIRLYIRRLHRYSLRHLQQSAIREHLNHYDNFASLPKDVRLVYHNIKLDHLRLKSRNSPFDLINYVKIKNELSLIQ